MKTYINKNKIQVLLVPSFPYAQRSRTGYRNSGNSFCSSSYFVLAFKMFVVSNLIGIGEKDHTVGGLKSFLKLRRELSNLPRILNKNIILLKLNTEKFDAINYQSIYRESSSMKLSQV